MGIVRIQLVNHMMFLGLSENGVYLKLCNFGEMMINHQLFTRYLIGRQPHVNFW